MAFASSLRRPTLVLGSCGSMRSRRSPATTQPDQIFMAPDLPGVPQHCTKMTAQNSPPEFLGHPRGLAVLFATEMWERFSYYGMRALLVLYMVKYLLLADRAETVVGLTALRRALEWLFGPLDIQPLASQIYGFYTGLVYLTPILGGLLADR